MESTATEARLWDLSHIFGSDEAFERERLALIDAVPKFARHRGHLGDSGGALLAALDEMFSLSRRAETLFTYACLSADQDLRHQAAQGRRQQIEAYLSDLAAAFAWVDPEILSLSPESIERARQQEAGLEPYRRYLEKLEKRRAHTLDEPRETLLGASRLIRGDGHTISELLLNAEIPWSSVRFEDGSEARIDPTGYGRHRARAERRDRVQVFQAFHEQLRRFKGSIATSLYATVKEHVFEARVRGYSSCLEAALSVNEVDPAVYRMLLKEIDRALPTLHRYLRLRQRILGVETLEYHDIYVPLTSEAAGGYEWAESQRLVLSALETLGDSYVGDLSHAFRSRWIDVDPRPGKRSGAYVQDGAFGAHPYMLLNHHDDYHSASTLAHESGHLMHSLLSQRHCPYPTSRYVIFVAEVASTFNEALLFHHALGRANDDRQRLGILGHWLEQIRATVFRQTMFAEFELAIHEAVEAGEALTGEWLSERYRLLLERYHGHESGVLQVDPEYAAEWAYVPHFHYDFYVYQYATSFVAATALARRVLAGDRETLARYLAFLGSGSSRPPVELLTTAGVDMTSPDPIRATISEMNEVMDRIERLLPA